MIREKTLRIGIVVAMICAMVVLIACSSTSGGEPLQIVENDEPEQHIKIPEEYVGSWLVAASAEFADGKLIAKKAENRGIVSVSEESIALYKDDYESEISSNKYTIEGGNVAIEFDDGSYGTIGVAESGVTVLAIGSSLENLEQLNLAGYYITRYSPEPDMFGSEWFRYSDAEKPFGGSWRLAYMVFDGRVISKEEINEMGANLTLSVFPGGLSRMVQGDDVVFDPWSIVDGNMLIVDAEDGTELEFEYSEESPQELENRIDKLREATEGAKYSNKNKADGILRQTALIKRDPDASMPYLTVWFDDMVQIFSREGLAEFERFRAFGVVTPQRSG